LIYGIAEEKGIPKALDGLDVEDFDKEKLRLENLIRDGIEPRIPSLTIGQIPLSSSNLAIVIRISKSWIGPHRVRYQGHDKFYSRNSAGKYQLDVAELRIAFNLSETVAERIRNFRRDRISNIVANETPVLLPDIAKIVLHLIPINAFSSAQSLDIDKIASHPEQLHPISSYGGWNCRYNLDGFLIHSVYMQNQSYSYVQLFRNGIIEALEAATLRPHRNRLLIPSVVFEERLINSLSNYLSVLKTLTVEPPIFVFLTLLGVKGYCMGSSKIDDLDELYAIDRDIILLPEITIENYQATAEEVLKPCFDSIWNACGFQNSWNYKDGKWVGR
jgi:hypothetical protein